jgi:hypothetical protein
VCVCDWVLGVEGLAELAVALGPGTEVLATMTLTFALPLPFDRPDPRGVGGGTEPLTLAL